MDENNQKTSLGGLARKLIQMELLTEKPAISATEQAIRQKNRLLPY